MRDFLKRNIKTVCLFVLLVLVIVVTYCVNHAFLKAPVIRNMLNYMAPAGIMMVGMAILLMSGSIDLSTDSQALLGIITFAFLLKYFPAMPWPVALVICIALAVAIALLHSFLCNKLGFMPFIATIAMSSVYAGAATVWSQSQTINIMNKSFTNLATIAFFGGRVPLLTVVMCLIILVYGLMLTQTRFGRSIYMCGGNRMAARLSGLNPARISRILFINNSVLAVIGGLAWASQKKMAAVTFSSSAPSMSGMTAAILGGVSFMGGGSTGLGGAFIGLLLLNTFTQSLNYYPIFQGQRWTWLQTVLGGLILIIALIIDNATSRRQAKLLLEERKKTISGKAA
jgi:ribose/xylose/arabinose/galactoside ABC-type transport system permease subunit